jgi:DNA-binding LytR/AlgR family response regulator
MINCIIIDDEQFAVDALLKYIELMPILNVVKVYLRPEDVLKSFSDHEHIHIVFMDIDMPNLSGIELAQVIRSRTDILIFTTSHSRYALQAYEVEGDAFLLKPFSLAKFAATINRFVHHLDLVSSRDDFFLVKSKEDNLSIVKVMFQEIVVFESMNNYVKIHLTAARSITAYLNLQDVLDLIRGRDEFIQIHRAFVISTKHIELITNNSVTMKPNLSINVGDIFKEKFNLFLSKALIKTSRKLK